MVEHPFGIAEILVAGDGDSHCDCGLRRQDLALLLHKRAVKRAVAADGGT